VISTDVGVTMKAQCFFGGRKSNHDLKTGEPYSLRSVIIYSETGWMLQHHRNDLLYPEVLNSPTEFGPERKLRAVGVDSVTQNVLAVCLYGGSVYKQESEK
jgi:hypothetical protein